MGYGTITGEPRAESRAERTEAPMTRVETRIHQRQCTRCQRWFWAWDAGREQCFVCDAPPPGVLREILAHIHGASS